MYSSTLSTEVSRRRRERMRRRGRMTPCTGVQPGITPEVRQDTLLDRVGEAMER